MGFLQYSDIVFNYNFQGSSTVLFLPSGRMYSTGPSLAGGLATPYMDAAVDVTAQFVDTDRGYRDSYGRYYEIVAETDHMWLSDTTDLRALWEKASFTYGFMFRDISTGTGTNPGRILLSKPSTDVGTANIGLQLAMDDGGSAGRFGWRCVAQDATPEVATINNVPKFKWIIGYVIKADGVQSRIGLKIKGDASWTTANSGSAAITMDYDNAKDAALLGAIDSTTGAKGSPFWGDMQRFCMWDVAITESTVQSSLEDHFGRADTIVAVQRSAILS